MVVLLTIELLTSTRGKDKAAIQGSVHTLARSVNDIQQWICEKRRVCKARMHTRSDQLIKPIFLHEIHAHGSDPARVEMLKGYNYVKQHSRF